MGDGGGNTFDLLTRGLRFDRGKDWWKDSVTGFGVTGDPVPGAKAPEAPKTPAAPKQKDAQAAALVEADRRRKAAARSKSVYTSALGLKEEATTSKKMLLGQ